MSNNMSNHSNTTYTTVAKKLFEEFAAAQEPSHEDYPNYGSHEELCNWIDDSFYRLFNPKNYRNEDELINDLEDLADMSRVIRDQGTPDALSNNQRELIFGVVYDGHIHPEDLSDDELASVIIELSNQAKLALRDYDL